MTIFLRLSILTVLSAMTLTITAQGSFQDLEPGTPLTITLDDGQPAVVLRYTSPGDETITIFASDAGSNEDIIDTVMRVIAPDESRIAYADHNPGDEAVVNESDARIPALYLAGAGTYMIWVGSYGEVGRGEIDVMLEVVDVFDIEDIDKRVLGRLPEGRGYRHTLDIVDGGTYTITARDSGGTLDPVLAIFAENGDIIAQNDDHSSTDLSLDVFDAQIYGLGLSAGTYDIVIRDYLGRAGTFELRVVSQQSNP